MSGGINCSDRATAPNPSTQGREGRLFDGPMTTLQQAERDEAIGKLRKWLKPGDTVYTILRHVSRSGMSRSIGVVLLKGRKQNSMDLHPNYLVAKALGYRQGKGDGVVMGGCGMDMGFALVYNLGRTLWPNGNGKTVTGRNGDTGPETDGGYLLEQRWL